MHVYDVLRELTEARTVKRVVAIPLLILWWHRQEGFYSQMEGVGTQMETDVVSYTPAYFTNRFCSSQKESMGAKTGTFWSNLSLRIWTLLQRSQNILSFCLFLSICSQILNFQHELCVIASLHVGFPANS